MSPPKAPLPTTSAASPTPAPKVAAKPSEPPPPFAAIVSARADELPMCRRGGPEGAGVAEVVFLPEGVAKVSLSEPYARTETGACIARRLVRDARPFDGAPIVVRLRFSL